MKKFSYLSLFALILSLITSCATLPEYKGKKPEKDDLSSLRKHLAFNNWKFLPLSPTETIVSFYDWQRNKNVYNIKNALKDYCKVQGGTFYGTFCEGGNDPFSFRIVKGKGKFYKSSGTYFYNYFAYVKTTKPDINLDYGFYNYDFMNEIRLLDLDKFIEKNSGFAETFKDLNKEKDKYIFEIYTYQEEAPFEITKNTFGGFWEIIEYCKAHNGEIQKIENENRKPFNIWMKELFLNHSGRSFFGYPSHKKFTLEGKYVCTSSDQPFKFTIHGIRITNSLGGFAVYKVKLWKVKNPPKNQFKIDKTLPSKPKQTSSVKPILSIEDKLALDAVNNKTQIIKRDGPRIYKATYAFSDEGCQYALVVDQIPRMEPPNIMTYKICNGKIVEKNHTRVIEPIPNFIKPKIKEVINQAKLRKFAIYKDNYGYTIAARALRENDLCNIDAFVMHNNQIIFSKTINICN